VEEFLERGYLVEANLGWFFWLTKWNRAPSLYIGTLLLIGLYLYAIGPLRKKYHVAEPVKRSQVIAFLSGIVIIFLALASPLDELGDEYLFSAHMVQHLLITVAGPPLLLLAMPQWLLEPLLHNRVIFYIGKFFTFPLVAFFLYNGDILLWHFPPLYDATLADESIHIVEHMTFMILAALAWWPVFGPLKEGWPRLSTGGQIIYLFLSGMPTVLLGAGLTFFPPIYAPYIQQPVRAWGISPTLDQQLGGLIMWVPGNLFYIVVVSILFIRWMQRQDAKQRATEAALYEEEEDAELVQP